MRFLALVPLFAGLALAQNPPPPAISGYSGPVQLAGAIQAPDNSYMGYTFHPFTGGSTNVDPSLCAQDCNAQTRYDREHPNADCSYQPCVFFDAYVENKNGVPEGIYCAKYNATWGPAQATNTGQYRGSDVYTISQSYGYSLLNPPVQPAYSSINCDGPFVKDGGFEDVSAGFPYLGPWKATQVGGGSGAQGGWSPGYQSNYMLGAGLFGSNPSPSITVSQTLTTTPGTHYSYSMWYRFDDGMDICVINLTFPDGSTNQVSLAGKTWGNWYNVQTTFTGGGQELLSINFFCTTGAGGQIFIDNIVIGLLP
jgi:hypothetical protein